VTWIKAFVFMCGNFLSGTGLCVDGSACTLLVCVISVREVCEVLVFMTLVWMVADFWGADFCTWALLYGDVCIENRLKKKHFPNILTMKAQILQVMAKLPFPRIVIAVVQVTKKPDSNRL
jgi:hypothetical protein